jgi:hypothetical protein
VFENVKLVVRVVPKVVTVKGAEPVTSPERITPLTPLAVLIVDAD